VTAAFPPARPPPMITTALPASSRGIAPNLHSSAVIG
jgi:hypothetical protein